MENPDWINEAACKEAGVDMFPEQDDKLATQAAVKVCIGCTALEACRDYAMRTHQNFGVWGGMSERNRTSARRSQARWRKSHLEVDA